MNRRAAVCACLHAAGWGAWALLAPPGAAAQAAPAVAEHQVKAAYLYKFLDFVEWPAAAFESPHSPYVIGVAGHDALAEELEALLARRRPASRPVVARRLRPGEAPTGLHVLFVGRGAAARAGALLAATEKSPVLTVTDTDDGLAAGSVISFAVEDQRVRFDVALRRAEAHELKISSRLLGVARRVVGAPS
ncbi:MAG TPA: YfiR family protein [Rhizobacter sp.]